jgi:hypothetical protein
VPQRRVWKFPLSFGYDSAKVAVEMPAGAIPRHLGLQRGRPCLWAEVDPEREAVTRVVQIVNTGGDVVPEDGVYLGTLQLHRARGGELVFHFYLLSDATTETIMAENMAVIERAGEVIGRIYTLAGDGQRPHSGERVVGERG